MWYKYTAFCLNCSVVLLNLYRPGPARDLPRKTARHRLAHDYCTRRCQTMDLREQKGAKTPPKVSGNVPSGAPGGQIQRFGVILGPKMIPNRQKHGFGVILGPFLTPSWQFDRLGVILRPILTPSWQFDRLGVILGPILMPSWQFDGLGVISGPILMPRGKFVPLWV